jgi:hypothetical protein
MNIVRLKRVGRWPLDKLVDAIVYLLDLWLRFLLLIGWSPKIKSKSKKKT